MAASHVLEDIRNGQRAQGHCHPDYPDYYFRISDTEHMTELKDKFRRMREYIFLDEQILKQNKNMCAYCQDIVVAEVPKLGKEAAVKAIEEWGQSKSKSPADTLQTAS